MWGPLWTGCCHEAGIILCLGFYKSYLEAEQTLAGLKL